MGRVTEAEFAAVVKEVASELSKVQCVTVSGFTARVTIESGSGKSDYESYLEFDGDTGRCLVATNPYGAKIPRWFVQEVESRL